MSDVIPYSNLAENPTEEAIIYWIDDRDSADGSPQSIHYGDGESDLSESVTDDGPDEVPALDGTWLYVAVIDELDADTRYYAEIRDDSGAVLETCQWVTLPESLNDRDVKVAIHSDWHKDVEGSQYMDDPEDIDVIWNEKPDISLFAGDYLTNSEFQNGDIAEEWVGIFRDYYARFDDEELIHILAAPGNHEVGNHQWDGTTAESVNPEAGYFQFFYGHPRLLDPPGENYGQITVSDYLQILALDTHSSYPDEVAEWLWVQSGVPFVIPFQHEGFVQLGSRDENDLRDNVRRAWFRQLYQADNVFFWQHGHVHTEGRSVPLKFSEEEPADDEYFELDDGYVIEAENAIDGLTGFGEGWRDDLSLRNEWYVDRVQQERNFTLVELTESGGTPSMTVNAIDSEGKTIDTQSYDGDYGEMVPEPEPQPTPVVSVATVGDARLGDITFGGKQP